MAKEDNKYKRKGKIYKVKEVDLIHTAFDIEQSAWKDFAKYTEILFRSNRKRSYAMRLLIHGLNEGFIDLLTVESKLKKMEKEFWI